MEAADKNCSSSNLQFLVHLKNNNCVNFLLLLLPRKKKRVNLFKANAAANGHRGCCLFDTKNVHFDR